MRAQKDPGPYEPGSQRLGEVELLQGLLNSNSHGNGHTDHGVVTGAQEAHHLNMGRDGGRAGELSVTVHTAHGIGQAIGSRATTRWSA